MLKRILVGLAFDTLAPDGSCLPLAISGRSMELFAESMRLGIEVATCTRARTGVGYYTEHLVDAVLETRGPDDEVVLFSNKPPAPELASRWSPHLRVSGQSVRAAWMQWDVPRLLSEERVDVAIFPNYVVPVASPCPSVVVVYDLTVLRMPQHCTLRKRLLMRLMLRHSVATASAVATLSDASKGDIETLLGVSPERITLLPGAAHPSCRRAPPDAVAAVRARYGLVGPYVLTVGTLEPRKDLVTLLRAFDQLGARAQGRQLVVVGGRGWHDRRLVRELEKRSADGRVRWLGYVNETDLVGIYSGADLFVLASTLEGFGLPVLEAMACGTPVVASNIPALREVGGDFPRFVPPGDPSAFATAIEQALGDRDGATAAHTHGPARASEFSWTRTAELLWARARITGAAREAGSSRASPVRRSVDPTSALGHPPPVGLSAREWALLATVAYADLFGSPLPMDRALSAAVGAVFDEAEIVRMLRGPALAPLLTLHPSGFLVLRGREHLALAVPEREAKTRELVARARPTLAILSALPFVRALVTSGGVVHNNAGARPDVDLFVVTARGRVYTVYSLLVLATKLTGTRQLICPNYLVDESELPIAYHRDLFTAHQLVSSRPLSGQRAYEELCRANETWVRRFFPAFAAHPSEEPAQPRRQVLQRAGELALGPVVPALERLLRWGWRVRLRRRAAAAPRSDVATGDGILKLHLSDYRRRTLQRFDARLASLGEEISTSSQRPDKSLDPVGT